MNSKLALAAGLIALAGRAAVVWGAAHPAAAGRIIAGLVLLAVLHGLCRALTAPRTVTF